MVDEQLKTAFDHEAETDGDSGNSGESRARRGALSPAEPERREARPRPLETPNTLVDLLRARAATDGARDGYIFLNYRGGGAPEEARLSYGGLLDRATAIAGALQTRCARGDRVLILCPPGLDYIAAFFGCQLAGLVAVPAYPPRDAKHMLRLNAVIKDAGAAAILAAGGLSDQVAAWAGAGGGVGTALPPVIAVDRVDPAAAADWRDPRVGPKDLAFLQYTSGTTGRPKGVMVSHDQAMDNAARIQAASGVDRRARIVLWLPPYHDSGLMAGLIVPLAAGTESILMSPSSFLQRPHRWLDAVSTYRASHTMAPNFAYQLCVDSISDEEAAAFDLRSIVRAASGAEQTRYATLRAFVEKFAPAGFRYSQFTAAYGLSETVVLATAVQGQAGPKVLRVPRDKSAFEGAVALSHPIGGGGADDEAGQVVVSCGSVIDDHSLRIVDPETRRPVADGSVGEVWLSGPSVASGYWNQPQATEETFAARLEGTRGRSRIYLRTGDLGALADGELFVLGRIKEMIIVRGRNLYAQDLEEAAAASDPLLGNDRTIAFGVEAAGEEQVVLVHEVARGAIDTCDPDALASAMRRAVLGAHEIDPAAIVFVKPATLPRTATGKLQRGQARDQFLTGKLIAVAEWRAPDGRREA